MGLDMYLYAFDPDDRDQIKKGEELPENLCDIAYWRKANAIHKYFCDHGEEIKEQRYYFISRKTIEDLLKICSRVLVMRDEEYSDKHLPTSEGFFFGSVDYDEWYYSQLEDTIDTLKTALNTNDSNEFFYYASW